jgi:hypothetical protein
VDTGRLSCRWQNVNQLSVGPAMALWRLTQRQRHMATRKTGIPTAYASKVAKRLGTHREVSRTVAFLKIVSNAALSAADIVPASPQAPDHAA